MYAKGVFSIKNRRKVQKENEQKKNEINTCANPRSPYNAHPLTDDELTTATKDSEEKRKKFEKTLDSSEE
ncbi:hypothetical protein [Proteus vulgaris]|uniref:hypothetical protein n=1 Tax=Proteus vulgaris TaxID=585 RepID=UPI000E1B606F|nr:hypothetical protein [Proteus vulgaris]